MLKKTRDFNAAQCMIWMYKYNPKKVDIFMIEDYPKHLISLVPISQLKFPEGWYYSEKTKTLNNENSAIRVRIDIKE